MYQQTIVIGNVGRDPEMRYTQGGAGVCSFTVAANFKWTDRNTNEKRERTTWFNVSAWGNLADTCNQYVRKGMLIMVSGEVSARAYTGQDGQPRASLDLRARDVKFLSSRDQERSGGYSGGSYEDDYQEPADDVDDIPF